VIVEKMKRKFGVDVLLKTPKVPYLETIRATAKVQGKYKKQSGGRGSTATAGSSCLRSRAATDTCSRTRSWAA